MGEAPDDNAPELEGEEVLTLQEQVEQVEEAADEVAAAIQAGEMDRAQAILEQLETWRANLSSTLSEAKAQTQNPELAEALTEIRNLRSELDALKTGPKPSASPTPSDPPPPTPSPATPTPTPRSDASPMELPGSGDRADQEAPPPVPESPRQKRRGI